MDLGPMLSPVRDIGEFIRDQRETAQLSLRALARKTGISNPYLSQVERGLRRPSAEILTQIAQGLSISAEGLLTRAGVLPERADVDSDVIAAIKSDVRLAERQKTALTEIYLAFVTDARSAKPAAAPEPVPSAPTTMENQHA